VDIKLTGNLRVCPKLSKNHIQLGISDKMRVRLATQVRYLFKNKYNNSKYEKLMQAYIFIFKLIYYLILFIGLE